METCNVVLTFGSVNKTYGDVHLDETYSAVLLHGTICFLVFTK